MRPWNRTPPSVNIEGHQATVWASSQTPFRAKEEVAAGTRLPPEKVRVISPFVGGGFGGKTRNLQVVEAARLAKLSGRPVQVAWSREEEFFNDSFRPAAVVKIKSGLTDKAASASGSIMSILPETAGLEHFYRIPHHAHLVPRPAWGGAPGFPSVCHGRLARAGQQHQHLRPGIADRYHGGEGRYRSPGISDAAPDRREDAACAASRGRKIRLEPARRQAERGHGVACGIDAGTYVATMAEVEVDRDRAMSQVKRVVCAQDMGLAINPEGARHSDGGLHHHGPRLRPDGGHPFQGRRNLRPQFRHL